MRAILEAAAQLLETGGSAEATTDHIAQRAGVSIGSLYQYFPSKEAIVLALAQCHVLETTLALGSALADLERVPPLESVLRTGVRGLLEIHTRRPRLHRALFEETVFRAEDLTKLEAGEALLVERIARYLERAPDADAPRAPLAARVACEALFTLVHRFALAPPPGYTPEECESEIVRLLQRYLGG